MNVKTDDRELLKAYVCSKNERAFRDLVQRHQEMMRVVAWRVCGNHEDAKDAMQRALIAFARRAGEITADPGVGPWLHRAVTLEALAVRRKGITRSIREQEAMLQKELQSGGLSKEIAAELDEAIDKLSSKDRSVIVLHFLERQTFRTIAQKHGGSEAAWQKRGTRALEKLSAILRRRGIVASGTMLASGMACTPVDAAIPSTVMNSMLNEALGQSLIAGVGTQASTSLWLIMKLKLVLASCFIGGVIFSYSWENRDFAPETSDKQIVNEASSPMWVEHSMSARAQFSLERVADAISHYDSLDGDDVLLESRLRKLMFTVPDEYLDDVYEIFENVRNKNRFHNIVACFYGRWAEIDPKSAWVAAIAESAYQESARRGTMITWLNIDSSAALEAMTQSRSDKDRSILDEFVSWKSQHAPSEAAEVVDQLAQSFPKADRMLFEKVAKAWSYVDPDAAGEWVSNYWDKEFGETLLKRFSWRVARMNVDDGLRMADRIEDPQLRDYARFESVRWSAIGLGVDALHRRAEQSGAGPVTGFPENWSLDEINAFARGTMLNHWDHLPQLIELAATEEQRQEIYEGSILGGAYSKPKVAIPSVENISPEFVSTEVGQYALRAFILRFYENNPAAATSWLDQRPVDAKTVFMRNALENRNTD